MKILISLFVVFICNYKVLAQSPYYGIIKGDSIIQFKIGDTIVNYKSRLTSVDGIYIEDFYPKSFKYNKLKDESLLFGGISFNDLIISINKGQKIDNIYFTKSYLKKDSPNSKVLFKNELKNLIENFNTLFRHEAMYKIEPRYGNSKSIQEIFFWRDNKLVVIVSAVIIKRKGVNLYAMLDVSSNEYNDYYWRYLNQMK
jgi:hypothetical protein